MRRYLFLLLAAVLLILLAGCGGNGPIWPGDPKPPVTPPPGPNPGGAAYQLQVYIGLSKTTGNAPMPVNMWANVKGGKGPYYYRWDVNGDGLWDYGGIGVSEVGIHYASAGLYHILLEVEDSLGQAYRATGLVQVKPSGPAASPAAIPGVGVAPIMVTLDGSGSYDIDGDVVYWEWDFESDGVWDYESDTSGVTTAVYELPGTYNASLRVTDDDELTDIASVQIIAL